MRPRSGQQWLRALFCCNLRECFVHDALQAHRAFVELAAIVDARLQPERGAWIGERMRAVTTLGAARDYLVEVATKLRVAGLIDGSEG